MPSTGGGGKSAQRTDFDAAEVEAKASLNEMFLGSFIGSEQFQGRRLAGVVCWQAWCGR